MREKGMRDNREDFCDEKTLLGSKYIRELENRTFNTEEVKQ